MTIDCHSCGRCIRCDRCTAEPGCESCTLCQSCTPAACICHEGRALRREDQADRMLRLSKEAQTWG